MAYIDADWSAGYVGVYAWWYDTGLSQEFDDVVVGLDNNGDGDFVDAGDAIQARDAARPRSGHDRQRSASFARKRRVKGRLATTSTRAA